MNNNKYEVSHVTVERIKVLSENLSKNLEDAQNLYNEIKEINSTGYFVKNLFDMQFVIDWQDGLNAVSITKDKDACK